MFFIKFTAIMVLCLAVNAVFGYTNYCPNQELYSPCICQDIYRFLFVSCDGKGVTDQSLAKAFKNLSKNFGNKRYYELDIDDSAITQLNASIFRSISFDQVYVRRNQNLTKADPYTFPQTSADRVGYYNNPNLKQNDDN